MPQPCLKTLCITRPHVLEAILHHLSGSESASLLAVFDLLEDADWKLTRDRFVRPLRDIPEHAFRITDLSQSHKVFLVGHDVKRWMERLQTPLDYWEKLESNPWNEKPLKIWIAARNFACLEKRKRFHADENGNIVFEISDYVQWERSARFNEQNIRVVWTHHHEFYTPLVTICPVQDNLRSSGDAMGGSHVARNSTCETLPPGADCKFSDLGNVMPFMPYINTEDGEVREMHFIDDPEFGEAPNFAFLVRFRCYGENDDPRRPLGPMVCRNLQGIPWFAAK